MAISNVSACLVSRDIPHSSFTIITWPFFLANMAMTPLIAMSGRVVCALAGPQKPDNSRHSGAVTCPAVPIAVKSFSLDDQNWCFASGIDESMHLITI